MIPRSRPFPSLHFSMEFLSFFLVLKQKQNLLYSFYFPPLCFFFLLLYAVRFLFRCLTGFRFFRVYMFAKSFHCHFFRLPPWQRRRFAITACVAACLNFIKETLRIFAKIFHMNGTCNVMSTEQSKFAGLKHF